VVAIFSGRNVIIYICHRYVEFVGVKKTMLSTECQLSSLRFVMKLFLGVAYMLLRPFWIIRRTKTWK